MWKGEADGILVNGPDLSQAEHLIVWPNSFSQVNVNVVVTYA